MPRNPVIHRRTPRNQSFTGEHLGTMKLFTEEQIGTCYSHAGERLGSSYTQEKTPRNHTLTGEFTGELLGTCYSQENTEEPVTHRRTPRNQHSQKNTSEL
jgi:hypothetical protein